MFSKNGEDDIIQKRRFTKSSTNVSEIWNGYSCTFEEFCLRSKTKFVSSTKGRVQFSNISIPILVSDSLRSETFPRNWFESRRSFRNFHKQVFEIFSSVIFIISSLVGSGQKSEQKIIRLRLNRKKSCVSFQLKHLSSTC